MAGWSTQSRRTVPSWLRPPNGMLMARCPRCSQSTPQPAHAPLLPDPNHVPFLAAFVYPQTQDSTREHLPHGIDHFCSEVGVCKLVQGGNGAGRVEAVSLQVHNRLVVAVLVRSYTP